MLDLTLLVQYIRHAYGSQQHLARILIMRRIEFGNLKEFLRAQIATRCLLWIDGDKKSLERM